MIVLLTKVDALNSAAIGQLVDEGNTIKEAKERAGDLEKQLIVELQERVTRGLNQCRFPPKSYLPLSSEFFITNYLPDCIIANVYRYEWATCWLHNPSQMYSSCSGWYGSAKVAYNNPESKSCPEHWICSENVSWFVWIWIYLMVL